MRVVLVAWMLLLCTLAPRPAAALDASARCSARKLRAMDRYVRCLFAVGKKALAESAPVDLAAPDAACAQRLRDALGKADARADACAAGGDAAAAEIYRLLHTSATAARNRVAPLGSTFYCGIAPVDTSTTRCVFTASGLPVDLAAFVSLTGYSNVDPNDLLITVEAYGAAGSKGKSGTEGAGGAGGLHGYASTTWSYQTFLDREATDLYVYVGEQAGCSGCGGAASLVLFTELEGSTAANALLVAGGGGGGAHGGSSKDGGDGGAGGVSTDGSLDSAAGSQGDHHNSVGGGGGGGNGGSAGSAPCSEAHSGQDGLGGYGGVKAANSDASRAGWIGAATPTFSSWSAGSGGNGKKSGANGGGGGGGWGGGGRGCNLDGGGGGGSMSTSRSYPDGASTPSSCGQASPPDASGECGKGGGNGVVVLDFRSSAS